MPNQQRHIVFFLGAGASHGAGATAAVQGGGNVDIPMQGTFWATFLRFCRSQSDRKLIEQFLFRYFLNRRVPSRAKATKRRQLLRDINVEEVFTFLSERTLAPAVTPSFRAHANKVWQALLREIGTVFGRFGPNAKTRQVYKQFLERHVRKWDTIVSFNYDIIFERSIPRNRLRYYEGVEENPKTRALQILKPHGSINWADGTRIKIRNTPERPVIIAPTHLKFVGRGDAVPSGNSADSDSTEGYLNHSPQIERVWAAMEREMRDAKVLVFIGYSFPSSDLYFSSVLRSILAVRDDEPHVVIVNPEAIAIRDHLKSRFALKRVHTHFDFSTFVQISRAQLLQSLTQ